MDRCQTKILRRAAFIVLILISTRLAAASDLDLHLEKFRKFAVQQMKEDQIPGMTIGFIRWGNGEERTWVEGFGYSDLENEVPTKKQTAYRLGSVSKPMTAAAVLLLAERGEIDLDAEVQTYVPYFPKKKWSVTVRQLLGHLGGISHYKNYDSEGRIKEHKNTREAIAIFQQFDLVAEPGTKYSYSSYGYNLLAAVVEGASGMSFGEFMKQNIWALLEMNGTRLDDPTELISNRARGYRILQSQIKNSEFVDISSRLGAGGTRSTVPDLLKFARGLVEGKLLSAGGLQLVYSSMTTRDGHHTYYSAGWGTSPANGHFMLRHSGSQQETATVLLCFPSLKLAIACAVNQEDAGASIFSQRLFELLMNERWDLTAYVTGDQNCYRAMDSVFAAGMSYFELHHRPMTLDAQELKAAFDYFRRSITTSKESDQLIADGRHPSAAEAYTKVGSYIAKIHFDKSGPDSLKRYHASGAIPFFADYLKGCEKNQQNTCAFPHSFRALTSQWNKSWARTNSEDIRWLHLNPETNLEEAGNRLRSSFQSATAYPDYSRELGNLTWTFLIKGENDKSLKVGELGEALYPQSARQLAFYGISLAALSQEGRGLAYLRKAYQLDPESPAEPGWLPDFAEELANAGKIQEAMKIMEAAVDLYPKNAHVLSDMGEAYLAMKDLAKAREYFEKALAIDPNLERAKSMLEKMAQEN